MRLRVKVNSGIFSSPMGGFDDEMDLKEGTDTLQLMEVLGIIPHTCFMLINGKLGALDSVLTDGDSIAFHPIIIGG